MGTVPKRASSARPRTSGNDSGRKPPTDFLAEVPYHDDQLGYDTWLLPPAKLTKGERFIQTVSAVSGPLLFVVAIATLIYFLFIAR